VLCAGIYHGVIAHECRFLRPLRPLTLRCSAGVPTRTFGHERAVSKDTAGLASLRVSRWTCLAAGVRSSI
jgi:hypothetical protein